MTLLTMVQEHCRIYALNVPSTVVGAQDTSTKQLWGLMNSLIDDVADQSSWQGYTFEALWTLVAGEDQGTMAAVTNDPNYAYANNQTFFDRTQRRPLYGPVSDDEWQALKAIPNPGPWYKYRIRQDHLLINPAPKAGTLSQIAFEYQSSSGVISAAGVRKRQFTADDDTSILPERILKRGLAARWKELKGLPSQSESERYYSMLNNYIARDGTKRAYNMSQPSEPMMKPGIFVPSGNWPV